MAKVGAPEGNKNGSKGAQLTGMLYAALEENDKERLRKGIQAVADEFAKGERWAVEFAFERIDGKLKQTVAIDIGVTEAQRVSVLTALIAEATGLSTDGGDAGLGTMRSVVPAEVSATAH